MPLLLGVAFRREPLEELRRDLVEHDYFALGPRIVQRANDANDFGARRGGSQRGDGRLLIGVQRDGGNRGWRGGHALRQRGSVRLGERSFRVSAAPAGGYGRRLLV